MGNKVQVEDYTERVIALSKTSDTTKVLDEMTNLIPLLLSADNTQQLDDIFNKFDYEQVLRFSNNLCTFMRYLMKEKLTLINQSSSLLLMFSNSIYQKYLNIRELVSLQFYSITEESRNAKEVILSCFPYNIFIYSIESLCDDNFLILKDVFQREIDKFDFIQKITALIFLIVNRIDYPITQNAKSSIEYIDTVKLFLFPNELFIKQSLIQSLLTKLYNTSIHNFVNLISSRVDPNIQINKFESFLFMNLSIILNLCCDINIVLVPPTGEQPNSKVSNTFNQRSLIIFKALFNSLEPSEFISKYNACISQTMKDDLMLTSHLFRKFVTDFYANIERLTVQFQVMVKILMIYIFENNPDISEMICLSNDIFPLLMENLKYANAFDLILLNLITQTQNFHIMMKHLNLSTEDICNDCLCTMITNRSNNTKLTYSSYFSLLIVLNLSSHFSEINSDISTKLNEFYDHFIKTDLTKDNYFDNILCITLYFEIVLSFINCLDFPSHVIFNLLKINKERIKCKERYSLFYKNNFELEQKGKRLMQNYSKVCEKVEVFINELNKKIVQDGGDMNYSQDNVLISIINKFTFKKDLNEILTDEEKKKSIFNSDIVKFLITTLHSNEDFTILV